MLKTIKLTLLLALVSLTCSAFTMKGMKTALFGEPYETPKSVYVVGYAFSFRDSVVWVSEIQEMPDVNLLTTGLLPMREDYSYQFKTYLEEKDGSKYHNVVTLFDTRREKLEKKMGRVKAKYTNKNATEVRIVRQRYFQYKNPATMWDNADEGETEEGNNE